MNIFCFFGFHDWIHFCDGHKECWRCDVFEESEP